MSKKKLQVNCKTPDELRKYLHKDDKYMTGVKILAISLIANGKTSRDVANNLEISFKSVCLWVKAFNNGGIEKLKSLPKCGRNPRLNGDQKKEIHDMILIQEPESYGYNSATWTGPMIVDVIKKKYLIEYKVAQIYNILHSLGLSYQKGRGIYPEADEEKRIDFNNLIKKNSEN